MSEYRCSKCGGTLAESQTHGGLKEYKCRYCDNTFVGESEYDMKMMYDMHEFSDKVFFLTMTQEGSRKEKLKEWNKNKDELAFYLKKYSSEMAERHYFAMCCVAYKTDGFLHYRNNRHEVEGFYKSVESYLKESGRNKIPENKLEILADLYEKELRGKKRNKGILIGSIAAGALTVALATGAVIGTSYAPVKNDPGTGITISIPNNAVSMFDKIGIKVDAELKSHKSVAYVDAKNALRNETQTFELYDIALLGGKDALDFNGTVKVEIPIPEGFDTSALKVYHIVNDEKYEEIPCSVSLAKNTVTFHTTHFSYYAIAERHPLVSFDTVGAGELEKQSVTRDTLVTEPTAPQKTGYTFGGWMADGKLWDFEKDTVKKDMTLTAKWIPNSYEITLNANGGTCSAQSIKVTYTSAFAGLPENVTKSGYTFLGWFTSAGTKVTKDTVLETPGGLTLTARFEANDNKVHFNANGGTGEMESVTLSTGASAKLPAVTFTRPGYTFLGWSTTADGEVEYANRASYTMGASSSYTLYAVWKANVNTLKFSANGGVGSMGSLSLQMGQSVNLPANAFTRDGYVFVGWATSAGGKAVYDDLAQYTMGANAVATLYAVWETNTNTVVFNSNNGIGVMASIRLETGESAELPKCIFTKTGYTFLGWSNTPNGSVIYADGSQYVMGNASSYTLYAVWEAKEYHISFDANGGTGEMASLNIKSDETRPLPANKFVKLGYTFKGWNTAHGDLVEYADLAEYTMTAAKDVTLYAVWEASANGLYFNPNGGTGTMTALNIKTGVTVYLPANTFVRPGYTFIGWSKTAGATSVDYAPGASYKMGAEQKYTLYAVWKVNSNTVKFDANGGTGVMSNMRGNTDSEITLPECGFVRNGYIFVGWSKTADSRTPDYAAGATYKVTSDAVNVLYAVWSGSSNQIVFNANGGEGTMNPMEIATGDTAELIANKFTRPGYTFIGWATSANGEKIYDNGANFEMSSPDTKVLYAVWTRNAYTASFETNGGNDIADRSFTVDDIFTLPVPNRAYYDFAGWYEDEEFEGEAVESLSGAMGNKIFFAKWTPKTYTVTFNPNGGSEMDSFTYTVEDKRIDLHAQKYKPTKKGYRFLGWYEDDDEVTEIAQGSHNNLTLEAKWEAIVYTIVYEENGGNPVADKEYTIKNAPFALPEAKREGYTFDGWYRDGEKVTEITEDACGNCTLTAHWSAITYTIEYDENGGDEISDGSYTVEHGTALVQSPTIKRTGYQFMGWYHNGQLIESVPAGSIGNLKLKAEWKEISYYVVYDANGGVGTMADSAHTYDLPQNLSPNKFEKLGYRFAGWSTTSTGSVVYQNEAKILNLTAKSDEIITLYAVWELEHYTITYITDGGSEITDTRYLTYTVHDSFMLPKSTKKGHDSFVWKDPNGTEFERIREGTVGDIKLTAHWTANTYMIQYDPNGGVGTMADSTHTYGESKNLTENAFQREGYAFDYWMDASGNKYSNNAIVTNLTEKDDVIVVLTAQWKRCSYNINYVLNGGDYVEGFSPKDKYEYNLGQKLPDADQVKKIGYRLVGWYDQSDASEKTVWSIPENAMEAKTYCAKWEVADGYGVMLNPNGGILPDSGLLINGRIKISINTEPFSIESYVPTREHYVFGGWYTDTEWTTKITMIVPKDLIQPKTEFFDIYLYARWIPKDYTVTFDTNGGDPMSAIHYNIETETFSLTNPTRKGYDFLGWFDGTGKRWTSIPKGTTGNITLEAKWPENPTNYTVTFDTNGGDPMNPLDYNILKPTFTLPTPTRKGYDFLGWIDSAGKSWSSIPKGTTENFTLKAQWKATVYAITVEGVDTLLSNQTDAKGNPLYGTLTPNVIYFTFGDSETGLARGFYQDEACSTKLTFDDYNQYLRDQINFTFGGLYSTAIVDNGHSYASYQSDNCVVKANGQINSVGRLDLNDQLKNGTLYALVIPKKYTVTLNFNETSQHVLSVTNAATASFDVYYKEKPEKITMPQSKYYNASKYMYDEKSYINASGIAEKAYDISGNATLTCTWSKKYSDSIYVYDKDTLESIRVNPSGKYLLICDIDLNDAEWTPIDTFSGTLDGDGHSVYNFRIIDINNTIVTDKMIAFIATNTGTIKNLTIGKNASGNDSSYSVIYDLKYKEDTKESTLAVGGIVGTNSGNITNCHLVNASVKVLFNDNNNDANLNLSVGGIVSVHKAGIVSGCTVKYCNFNAEAYAKEDSGDNNYGWLGGICGKNYAGVNACSVTYSKLELFSDGNGVKIDKFWNDEINRAYPVGCIGYVVAENIKNASETNCTSKSNTLVLKVTNTGYTRGMGYVNGKNPINWEKNHAKVQEITESN